MAGESLIIGNGNWGVKSSNLLGYNLINSKYVPRELAFIRATTGTRTNASGLIETTPYNIFTQSEQFDNALWGKASSISIAANTATAPNGTLTADSFILNSSGSCFIFQTSIVSFNFFTASIYIKYINRQFIQIVYGSGLTEYANFDILNGLVTGGSYTGASISNEGNGWFRISFTSTGVVTSLDTYIWAIDSGTALRAATCNGIGSYSIWGAQLVNGSSTLAYLPTTTRVNIPRIDYSTGTAALLMEPQRTNINLQSEDISGWIIAETTVVLNTTAAPDGMITADSLLETTATGTHITFRDITGLSGTAYTFSIYAKSIGGRNIQLSGSSGFSGSVVVDLSNGNILSGSGVVSNVGNGWYRISITATTTTTAIRAIVYTVNGASNSYAGDITKGVALWGAQLEAGAYPTSYIPTTSASVTRNEDLSTTSGMNTFIGQTEGTIFLDIDTIAFNSDWLTMGPISGSQYTNGIGLGYFSNSVRFSLSSPSGTLTSTTASITGRNKIAIAYKSGDSSIYINGVSVFSSAGAFSFGVLLDSITVASTSFQVGSISNNKLYSCALYKTRLSNAELADLTIGTIDPDAAAFFSRVTAAGGTLSGAERYATNTLVKQMKTAGIWNSMKAVYPMVGSSAAACAQNLISASYTGTFSSGWTFNSTGITGNGSSTYMNTGLNANLMSQTSISFGLYNRNNLVNSGWDLSSENGSTLSTLILNFGGSGLYAGSNSGLTSATNASALGFYINSRISNTSFSVYKNGSLILAPSFTTTGQSNSNFYLGSRPDLSNSTNRNYSFLFIGDGLDAAQNSNFYTAVQEFQTSLSRQV